jgi:hypothetical protein
VELRTDFPHCSIGTLFSRSFAFYLIDASIVEWGLWGAMEQPIGLRPRRRFGKTSFVEPCVWRRSQCAIRQISVRNNWFSLNQSFVFFGPDGLSEHEVQLQIMTIFRENPLKPVGCSIAPRTPRIRLRLTHQLTTGLVLSETPMSPRNSRVVSHSSIATIGLRPLQMMWVGKRGVRFGLPVIGQQ